MFRIPFDIFVTYAECPICHKLKKMHLTGKACKDCKRKRKLKLKPRRNNRVLH
jgi:hypothetical protein